MAAIAGAGIVLIPVVALGLRANKGCSEQELQQAMEPHYVRIEAGSFIMGSPEEEPGRWGSIETQHRVTLTRSFEMWSTQVTSWPYKRVMGRNPSLFKECGLNCPAEHVSWHAAARCCNKLSEQAGLSTCYECRVWWCKSKPGNICDSEGYRLPTEAAEFRGNDTSGKEQGPERMGAIRYEWQCSGVVS